MFPNIRIHDLDPSGKLKLWLICGPQMCIGKWIRRRDRDLLRFAEMRRRAERAKSFILYCHPSSRGGQHLEVVSLHDIPWFRYSWGRLPTHRFMNSRRTMLNKDCLHLVLQNLDCEDLFQLFLVSIHWNEIIKIHSKRS